MYKKIVITKTPLRISFSGGGTDISNFYKKQSGIVITSTIDKFVYVTVKEHGELFNRNYRLNYSRAENKNKLNKIQNDIIRETLKVIKINKPIYISSISDIPTNTGLGSSSAFTVGLIKALYEFKNKKISNVAVAKLASEIEIKKVKSPIGKQDQYSTSIGGLNILEFKKNNNVLIQKIKKKKLIKEIFNNSIFVWVGGARKANKILEDQNKKIKVNLKKLSNLKKLTKELQWAININKFSINNFAEIVKKGWEIKKKLSNKILNKKIIKIYSSAIQNGSLGGKLLGAGGGGFLFLVIKKKNILTFKKNMLSLHKDIKIIDFNYYDKGAVVLFSS